LDPFDRIWGTSVPAEHVRAFGRRAATVDAPVLLTGESGTGKGLLARAIHEASDRARRGFVAVNCAGIPETLFESEFFGHTRGAFTGAQQSHRGLFEQAHGGTLFLDEIGELAPALQAKLLTAIEDGEVRRLGGERVLRVDARLIAATGVDLEVAVRNRIFRRDLYHRLLVLAFRLPPLRERPGDIELFAERFLDAFAERYRRPITDIDRAARARLLAHTWPGNIRELAHAIEAAVLACDGGRVMPAHLPAFSDTSTAPPLLTPPSDAGNGRYTFTGDADAERRLILDTLHECGGNKTRAARRLGMARNTLLAKLRACSPIDADPPAY
jgi:two-component system, NtrC family, response regulator HydG